MQNLIKRLEKKGWTRRDINKAVKIINNTKQNKSKSSLAFDRNVYWILLAVIIIANFAISIALVPALVGLKGIFLYIVMGVLGIIFGLLFELVIRSIEHLEKKRHIILAILIPLAALTNIFIISGLSNNLIKALNLTNSHNSVMIGLVYSASFVLPYIIYRFVLKIEYYSRE